MPGFRMAASQLHSTLQCLAPSLHGRSVGLEATDDDPSSRLSINGTATSNNSSGVANSNSTTIAASEDRLSAVLNNGLSTTTTELLAQLMQKKAQSVPVEVQVVVPGSGLQDQPLSMASSSHSQLQGPPSPHWGVELSQHRADALTLETSPDSAAGPTQEVLQEILSRESPPVLAPIVDPGETALKSSRPASPAAFQAQPVDELQVSAQAHQSPLLTLPPPSRQRPPSAIVKHLPPPRTSSMVGSIESSATQSLGSAETIPAATDSQKGVVPSACSAMPEVRATPQRPANNAGPALAWNDCSFTPRSMGPAYQLPLWFGGRGREEGQASLAVAAHPPPQRSRALTPPPGPSRTPMGWGKAMSDAAPYRSMTPPARSRATLGAELYLPGSSVHQVAPLHFSLAFGGLEPLQPLTTPRVPNTAANWLPLPGVASVSVPGALSQAPSAPLLMPFVATAPVLGPTGLRSMTPPRLLA